MVRFEEINNGEFFKVFGKVFIKTAEKHYDNAMGHALCINENKIYCFDRRNQNAIYERLSELQVVARENVTTNF